MRHPVDERQRRFREQPMEFTTSYSYSRCYNHIVFFFISTIRIYICIYILYFTLTTQDDKFTSNYGLDFYGHSSDSGKFLFHSFFFFFFFFFLILFSNKLRTLRRTSSSAFSFLAYMAKIDSFAAEIPISFVRRSICALFDRILVTRKAKHLER